MQLPYHFEEETEYFGFIPASLTDEIVTLTNEAIFEAVEQFQKEIAALLPGEEHANQIQQAANILLEDFERKMDKNFDILELYLLRNIFRFPASFSLGQGHNVLVSEESAQLDESLKLKRDELLAEKLFQKFLENELASEEEAIAFCQRSQDQLMRLTDGPLNGRSFEETADSLVAQVETLKGIVSSTFEAANKLSRPLKRASDESLKEFNTLLRQKEIVQQKLKEEKTGLLKISDPESFLSIHPLL